MNVGRAVIVLRDKTITINNADLDEITRFVDLWQSGRRGGFDLNGLDDGGDPIKVPGEYRDVIRVDFPEVAS